MGFSLDLIEPNQEAHAAEFTCSICFQLVDAPLLTRCQHVFCTSCLQDWFDRGKPSCPTCSTELDPRHGAGELKLASPLAWRVLGRLRVRCSVPNCTWAGEYSEVTSHLVSDESHQNVGPLPTRPPPTPAAAAAAAAQGRATADAIQTAASCGRCGESAPAPATAGFASDAEHRRASAEALKAAGNSKFEQRIYADAIVLYTKAINLCDDVPTYYTNRGAAYFNQGDYAACVADCERAVKLEPTLCKAYTRMAKSWIEFGEYAKAVAVLEVGRRHCQLPSDARTLAVEYDETQQLLGWQQEGEAAYAQGDYSLARTFFANMLAKSNAPVTKLWLVRAELGLGLCDRALRTTREVIKGHPNITKAYVLRGQALLLAADFEQATKHLREALRLDPDDAEGARTMKKVRKLERHMDAAKQAATSREFQRATDEYTEALSTADAPKHAPLSASIHAGRAAAWLRLKAYDEALKDCAVAIYAQDDCKAAWLTKAQALHALGRHTEALADMQALSQTFGNDAQVSHALQRASFEVRKEKRPDYYALLKVPSIASIMEIKSAYKQRALEYHPDKHTESEGARRAAEEKFKLLGEALEILGDEFQRKLYDEG